MGSQCPRLSSSLSQRSTLQKLEEGKLADSSPHSVNALVIAFTAFSAGDIWGRVTSMYGKTTDPVFFLHYKRPFLENRRNPLYDRNPRNDAILLTTRSPSPASDIWGSPKAKNVRDSSRRSNRLAPHTCQPRKNHQSNPLLLKVVGYSQLESDSPRDDRSSLMHARGILTRVDAILFHGVGPSLISVTSQNRYRGVPDSRRPNFNTRAAARRRVEKMVKSAGLSRSPVHSCTTKGTRLQAGGGGGGVPRRTTRDSHHAALSQINCCTIIMLSNVIGCWPVRA